MNPADCELCRSDNGEILFRNDELRIVWINEPDYPGFCRVIWTAHVKEMTHLDAAARSRLMEAVFVTEAALIDFMAPDKINLASFGTITPHLHWHVIPRFVDDRHYPGAVWAAPRREPRSMMSDASESVVKQQMKERLHALLG